VSVVPTEYVIISQTVETLLQSYDVCSSEFGVAGVLRDHIELVVWWIPPVACH